ncbi:MAG: glycerophosphodiester phosphodiesterase family protein, partial [FCB group bacterium]|nr:glycerophosphodiester phosphodiesterase family protein [FCB group bacterium]
AFHAAGKTVSVWTVDDEAGMRRLAEWGVDNIITNKPDLCRKTLEEMTP